MIVVNEYKLGNQSNFEVQIYDGKRLMMTEDISQKAVIRRRNNFDYMMIYNNQMQLNAEVFRYLNKVIARQELNSRISALNALKILYNYQGIIKKDVKDFNVGDFISLKAFMKGSSAGGQELNFNLITTRQNSTINGYLSVFRSYYEYLGVNNTALLNRDNIYTSVFEPDSDIEFKVAKFKLNESLPKKPIEVPRYVSIDEFRKIISFIRSNFTAAEEIIVRLMFQCGLRIGEVLGLTADDLVIEKINEQYIPVAYIRNRVSDKYYQKAKTCMKVFNVKQYRSKDYNTEDYGWQRVIVPKDLFEMINEYIEAAHTKARNDKGENYFTAAIADRVRQQEPYEESNYYVFINSLGRPLSQTLWNERLRDIFRGCNLIVDNEIRDHNLNHRFRHGFAMFNINHLNCREIELAKRMRHSKLRSVYKYFRPTLSDAIKIKTDFVESLYEIMPELRSQ